MAFRQKQVRNLVFQTRADLEAATLQDKEIAFVLDEGFWYKSNGVTETRQQDGSFIVIEDQIDFTGAEPAAPAIGDEYVNTTAGVSSVTAGTYAANSLLKFNGTDWDEVVPEDGAVAYDKALNNLVAFDGAAWGTIGGSGNIYDTDDTLASDREITMAARTLTLKGTTSGKDTVFSDDGLNTAIEWRTDSSAITYAGGGSIVFDMALNTSYRILTNDTFLGDITLPAPTNSTFDSVLVVKVNCASTAGRNIIFDAAYETARGGAISTVALANGDELICEFVRGSDATTWRLRSELTATGGITKIADWVTATVYELNDIVQKDHLTLRRITPGTSLGTFTNVEAARWEAIAQSTLPEWAPSIILTNNEMFTYEGRVYRCHTAFQDDANLDPGNVDLIFDAEALADWQPDLKYEVGTTVNWAGMMIRRTLAASLPSEATFDGTEALRWEIVYQPTVEAFAVSTAYLPGQKVTINGDVHARTTAGLSAATMDEAETLLWTYLPNESLTSSQGDRMMGGTEWAALGEGLKTRSAAHSIDTRGGQFTFEDADAAGTTRFDIPLTRSFANTDEYTAKFEVLESALANQVIGLGYLDNGVSLTTQYIDIGVGLGSLVGEVEVGNVDSTVKINTLNKGDLVVHEIEVAIVWTGAGGASPRLTVEPAYNTDGTFVQDATATGTVTLVGLDVGDPSEFIVESDVIATKLNSSAGAVIETLPAATGTGEVLFFVNEDVQDNTATIVPLSGEYINSELDGVFYANNFSDRTTFMVTDSAAGRWSVRVVGEGVEKAKPYARIELDTTSLAAAGFSVADQVEVSLASFASNSVHVVPFTGNAYAEGGMVASVVDSTTFTENSFSASDASTYTLSSITVPDTARYRIRYKTPNPIDATLDGDEPIFGLAVNGVLSKYDDQLSPSNATMDGQYGEVVVDLVAGDRVQLVEWSNSAAESYRYGALSTPTTPANVTIAWLEVEAYVGSSLVAAGLVPSTDLVEGVSSLVSDFDLVGTGGEASYEDVGLSVTLPVAGKYLVTADLEMFCNGDDYVMHAILTDGSDVQIPDTARATHRLAEADTNSNSGSNATISAVITTTTANEVVKVRGSQGSNTPASVFVTGSNIRYVQLPNSTVVMPEALTVEPLTEGSVELSSGGNFTAAYTGILSITLPSAGRYRVRGQVCATYDTNAAPNMARLFNQSSMTPILGTEITLGDTDVATGNWRGTHCTDTVITVAGATEIRLQAKGFVGAANTILAGTDGNTVLSYEKLSEYSVSYVDPTFTEATTLASARVSGIVPSTTFVSTGVGTQVLLSSDYGRGGATIDGSGSITFPTDCRCLVEAYLPFTAVGFDGDVLIVKDGITEVYVQELDLTGDNGANHPFLTVEIDVQAGSSYSLYWRPSSNDPLTSQAPASFSMRQLPTTEVVTPGDVPVEDIRVLLGSGSALISNSTVTISDTWGNLASTYEQVDFEFTTTTGTLIIRQSMNVAADNWADGTRVVLNADATTIVVRDMDIAGNTANLFLAGDVSAGDLRIYGVKAQKTVVTYASLVPSDVPVNFLQAEYTGGNTNTTADNGGNKVPLSSVAFSEGTDLVLANSKVTLLAGKQYEVTGSVSLNGSDSQVRIYDFTNGVGLGAYIRINESRGNVGQPTAFVSPVADIEVGISLAGADPVTGPGSGSGTQVLTVREVPKLRTVMRPEDIVVDEQEAAGYVDIGDVRMAWGVTPGGTSIETVTFPGGGFGAGTISVNHTPLDSVLREVSVNSVTQTQADIEAGGTGPKHWQAFGPKP